MRRPFPSLMVRPTRYTSPSGRMRGAFWLGFAMWRFDGRTTWRFNAWTWRP